MARNHRGTESNVLQHSSIVDIEIHHQETLINFKKEFDPPIPKPKKKQKEKDQKEGEEEAEIETPKNDEPGEEEHDLENGEAAAAAAEPVKERQVTTD